MIKKIKLPDGSIKSFNAPDDWSNDQVKEAAINYFNLSKPEEQKQTSENTWGKVVHGVLNVVADDMQSRLCSSFVISVRCTASSS